MTDLKKPKRPPQPVAFHGEGEARVRIEWSDGRVTEHDARTLRGNCMCAGCVREMSGERVVTVEDVAEDVTAKRFQQVGNYAVRIYWSDGHNTGIYPFEKLREMAGVEEAEAEEPGEGEGEEEEGAVEGEDEEGEDE